MVVVVDCQDAVFQSGDGGALRGFDGDGRIERRNSFDLHPDTAGLRFDFHRRERAACDFADQEAGDFGLMARCLRLEVDGPLLFGPVFGAHREGLGRGQRLERERRVVVGDLLFDDRCPGIAQLHDLVGQREREGFGPGRDLQRDTMAVVVRDDRCRVQLHPVVFRGIRIREVRYAGVRRCCGGLILEVERPTAALLAVAGLDRDRPRIRDVGVARRFRGAGRSFGKFQREGEFQVDLLFRVDGRAVDPSDRDGDIPR